MGIEPMATRLKVARSTAELTGITITQTHRLDKITSERVGTYAAAKRSGSGYASAIGLGLFFNFQLASPLQCYVRAEEHLCSCQALCALDIQKG